MGVYGIKRSCKTVYVTCIVLLANQISLMNIVLLSFRNWGVNYGKGGECEVVYDEVNTDR